MEAALYLYPLYLDNEVSCRQNEQIRVLKHYVGDEATLLQGTSDHNSTGIKLSTGNGFPACLKEAVVRNEGTDLMGFCHCDYKFSTFLERFTAPTGKEKGSNFDPIRDYGDSTKKLRKQIERQMATGKRKASAAEKASKTSKDPTVAVAGKVVERLRGPFRPDRREDMADRTELIDVLKLLDHLAGEREETIFNSLRLNTSVVEKIVIEERKNHPALQRMWGEIEASIGKRKSTKQPVQQAAEANQRKRGRNDASKTKTVLGDSDCLNTTSLEKTGEKGEDAHHHVSKKRAKGHSTISK